MTRLAALIAIVGTLLVVQRLPPTGLPTGASLALSLGFALIAAYLVGDLAVRLRLPRLSGYLVLGLMGGPFVFDLITSTMARELEALNGLALAMIALAAGLEMNLARLRRQARAVLAVGGLTMLGTTAVIAIVVWLFWDYVPLPPLGATEQAFAALIVALLVASFSPTVSLAVIAETRARGPLTELVMAAVICADLLLIVIFSLTLEMARWAAAGHAGDVGIAVQLGWEIAGSLAGGAALGALFAFYLRHVGREVTIALLALCAVIAFGAERFHFEMILAALAAGMVVENIAPPEGDALKEAIERGSLPLLIIFFTAAGASLQLDAIAVLGWSALALGLVRLGCIRGFARIGLRLANLSAGPERFAWAGLVSQAGVTLGLATIVATDFPAWGGNVRTLIVALTAVHVLAGPIVFKVGLQQAGEIGSPAA